ncbi:MAG: HAD family hydrolase [Promethearchaeota archaeon]
MNIQNRFINFRGIIFDFDFTLADSSKGVEECVNYALNRLGYEEFPAKEINKTIGLTLDHTFLKLIGKQYSDKTEKFKELFIKRADEVMADLTVLFSETPMAIELLHNKGIKLGIVSTKFRYRIESILKRENLLNCFKVIVGGEDVSTLKPDPSGLLLAVKELNLTPSEVVYIGDSVTDAETAERAGITFIAILSGVTPRTAFNKYQVKEVLNNVSELTDKWS